jgi:formylmethanofuran dehydrogenase subunit C
MSWRLTLRAIPPAPLDASPLVPASLAALDARQVQALPITVGQATMPAGEWFTVQQIEGDALEIDGETRRVDRVGARMRGGELVVHGACGDEAGYGMRGGKLQIRGDAGDGLACGLRGGSIEVHGNAGAGVGGAPLGERPGMRGGRVLVHGDVGAQCGTRMRRGEILVGGSAGPLCAARLIAGTLVVCGRVPDDAGVAMRRGTLIVGDGASAWPAGFEPTGTWSAAWLGLLVRAWRGLPGPWGGLDSSTPTVERALGDRRAGGQGEMLVWRALRAVTVG